MKPAQFVTMTLLLVAFTTQPAFAVLRVGDEAPDFAADAALGGKPFTFRLAEALAKGPVVLYFYPKAFTTGCTIEAHAFAEATPRFHALGATVIGVSSDNIETLKRFSVEACRNQFAVAADAQSKVIQAYDAASTFSRSMAARVSYVIDKSGRIVFTHDSMSPEGHITETLKVIEQLHARPAQSSRQWHAERSPPFGGVSARAMPHTIRVGERNLQCDLTKQTKSLINTQARLDGLLADHAKGKHVSEIAIRALREEIAKQQHLLEKRKARRQAEREAFRRLPEEARERILAERRREEAESASEWAAFHAEQSADGESVMEREYEQAKSYLELIDAPLRWLPWILLICAPIAFFWGQNQKVVVGVTGLLVPWIGAAWFLVRANVLPRTYQRSWLWKCLFRLLDCCAGLGSDRTDDRR